jgi:alpha-D-ribose 1-methylphosphonate 5-triphosphate synthase subunit PhnH
MARPAHRLDFDFDGLFGPSPPLPPSVAALALTLADHLTPVWLSPSFAAAEPFLAFHASAPIARVPGKAAIVLAASPKELPELLSLNQGDPRYPDRSTTVILGGALEATSMGITFLATGPGLAEETIFSDHGLGMDFARQWELNRASYPLGVDVFLAGDGCLAGLPRSLALIPKPS